jgi:hypothetical protein
MTSFHITVLFLHSHVNTVALVLLLLYGHPIQVLDDYP